MRLTKCRPRSTAGGGPKDQFAGNHGNAKAGETGQAEIYRPEDWKEMRHLERRLKRLEARLTDGSGCVPYTAEWFRYWTLQVKRLRAGENVPKPPIAFFDAILAASRESERAAERLENSPEVRGGGEAAGKAVVPF
jgi:hypothetical protein